MTQKELSYFEDAIKHEDNIIKMIDVTISNLQDEQLKTFMQNELTEHKSMREKLLNHLEVKTNE